MSDGKKLNQQYEKNAITLLHADHSVSELHINFMVAQLGDYEGFFIRTVELPPELPDLMSPRGDLLPTRLMTAIGTKDANSVKFFSTYGGPCSPREVDDAIALAKIFGLFEESQRFLVGET